jgi:hypothetical protein
MNNFVFTHSGYRFPKHLLQGINFCKYTNPESVIYLIVDHNLRIPKTIREICQIKRVNLSRFEDLKKILDEKYSSQKHSQNGFWFKSILRFFLIEEWLKESKLGIKNFIHLESDCIPLITGEIYNFVEQNFRKIAVPIDTEGDCIPSVVYFPGVNQVFEFTDYIRKRIVDGNNLDKFYCNDITMLNEYKAKGKISALPSLPGLGMTESGKRIVFDPKSLGEYLFGKDTRHNKFILRSGYISTNKYYKILKKMDFNLTFLDKEPVSIGFLYEGHQYTMANIHNFSKRYDLFKRFIQVDKLEEIFRDVNTMRFRHNFMINHLLYFIVDKVEYFIRNKK